MKVPDAWWVICIIGRIRNTYKERLYIKEFCFSNTVLWKLLTDQTPLFSLFDIKIPSCND